ncbi:peroxidase [Maioricimonas rarisocia]|uniref:Peroxidase n=1 Tax=Maioricimonas rarisocia TaxID=2528026 RepID=A0A517ZCY5_9PLAN|nr:peroxidase family protein [Maioricimonas rarisocia]QDU40354.1 peroxidase [Maioricimonas rarisocia]
MRHVPQPHPAAASGTVFSTIRRTRPRRVAAFITAIVTLASAGQSSAQNTRSRTTARLNDADAGYRIQLEAVRNIDGTDSSGSGFQGAAHTPLRRNAPADYPGDGSGEEILTSSDRTNPRTVSNLVVAQDGVSLPNQRGMSDFTWAWGQFLDHDIDLTHTSPLNGTADIEIEDPNDPLGPNPIPVNRSDFDLSTGTPGNPRQQINEITAFIDASNVYGSDDVRAMTLRTLSGGLLKTSDGDLLPFNEEGLPNDGSPMADFFVAGDVRANENVVLTSMHTLFVREHNRLARLIGMMAPDATDEEIYQLARKIVGAELQIITFNEFLPAVLGPEAPTPDEGFYDSAVDPSIANEFAHALYRFGHSLLSSNLLLADEEGIVGDVALRDAFFNPLLLSSDPTMFDLLLGGLALQPCQELDCRIVDDLRNFLFGPPGAGGLDLASLNIQRGRDHGLPDYNLLRTAYGLPLLDSVEEITSDPMTQLALETAYDSIDNIDPWVGALSEDHLPGASVGPTLAAGLSEQFRRLLAGDRFSVLNDPDLMQPIVEAVTPLPNVSLADVVRANSTVRVLPDNVFFVDPPVDSDVVVRFDPVGNRVFVTGNRGMNRLVVRQTQQGLRVEGYDGTRINGRESLVVNARARYAVTVDLGGGDDGILFVNCQAREACVMLGDGNDEIRTWRSSATKVFFDPGEGQDSVPRDAGFTEE